MALSDETGTLASGLPTLGRIGPRKDVRALAELIRRHEVGEVVVGLPRNLAGDVGPQAQKVLDFIEQLRGVLKVPIVPWDERFTSVVAQHTMIEPGASRRDRKASVDKVAAILILQNYLDYLKLAAAEGGEPVR